METPEKPKAPLLSQLVAEFPHRHLILAGIVIALVFVSLLLTSSHTAQATRISRPLTLDLASPMISEEIVKAQEEPKLPWQEIKVRKGDNLSRIFKRLSLSANDVYELVSDTDDAGELLNLYPGQTLAVQIDDKGQLQALKHIENRLKSTVFERQADGFVTTHIQRDPEIRRNYGSAIITSSLYRAAQNAGLSKDLIMELADIFGGVIDFVYDVRAGDSFTLVYEEKYIDGEKTGNGPIMAAQFTNRGETFTAYRYTHSDGSIGYYDEKGVSMRKAFLRAPLDFTRISSGFNLKRLHPIFKTKRPHRGIDYAAPRGTPVYAAGDGRVIRSGYSKGNGNYVFINHGLKYETKYLHLYKRAVHSGEKVKQRQIIGWVGSTGYATGPHLHYEFLVDGVHRNPRTILAKLPKAKSIVETEKSRFLAQISGLQLQLAAYNNNRSLAKASQLSDNSTL